MKILIFFAGVLLGSLFGMVTLILVQINRETEEQLRKEVEKNENSKS